MPTTSRFRKSLPGTGWLGSQVTSHVNWLRRSEATHHHGGIHALVRPRFDEVNLSASIFLSRSPEELSLTRESKLANDEREGHERGDARSCNEIMSAGMSNFGKGIIFGIEVHNAPLFSTMSSGLEGSGKPVGMTLDSDAPGGEEVTDSVMGILFLVCLFRMCTDLYLILDRGHKSLKTLFGSYLAVQVAQRLCQCIDVFVDGTPHLGIKPHGVRRTTQT